jgi:glycosyltransferase involved in cell wall biosynthesis
LNDEELVSIYKNSKLFVQPSFEEGFGIPILEAMACGTPVVSSYEGSLKEVGGEAALYFNPKNITDMSDKISQVLNDQKLSEKLIEKGINRYKDFSWKNMALQTLEVYKKCF